MAETISITPARSRFWVSLPLLCLVLFYAKILAAGNSVLGDPDTYWHITMGQWILAHGTVPHHDLFSLTRRGAPFTPAEWLGEVIIASIYDHLGWAGVIAATALSAATALAIQLKILMRRLAPIYAMIATAITWDCVQAHLLARPHIFTLPILVVWVGGLVAARSAERRPPFWLLPLIALWANLHGGYMWGIGLAALLGAEAVLSAVDWPARFRAARGWALFGVLCLGAALLTPSGLSGLWLPFKLLHMHFAMTWIQEWRSPDFQHLQPVEIVIMVLLFVGLSTGWRIPPLRLAIVLALLHMALQHGRLVEELGLAGPILLAPALGPQLVERSGGRITSRIDRVIAELAKPAGWPGAVAGLVALVALSAVGWWGAAQGPKKDITPKAALAAVAAHHVTGPVFNSYDFGGYLIFRGISPFIDGRDDLYGDKFLERYVAAIFAQGNALPRLLKKYGIAWTLLPPSLPAVALLAHLPGWHQLYADKTAVVDVREAATKH